jgi:hypothetical protein
MRAKAINGCDAISPHTATSMLWAHPTSTIRLMRVSTAG